MSGEYDKLEVVGRDNMQHVASSIGRPSDGSMNGEYDKQDVGRGSFSALES